MSRLSLLTTTLAAFAAAAPALAGGSSIVLTPVNSIQAAVNSGLYTEIVLSPGTYAQTVDFDGAALTLRSSDPDDPAVVAATVIDGSFLGSSVLICDDGEGPDTKIVGLTITGGEATGASPNDRGGGLRCFDGSPTVDRCVFIDNEASNVGGAIYQNVSSPTIIDCTFIGNSAAQGGGVYLNMGSGSLTLTRCVFEENFASVAGAGLRSQAGAVTLIDCDFVGNLTPANGGALYANNTILDILRTAFVGNVAERGGGIYTLSEVNEGIVSDSLFDGNEATATGAAMYFRTPMTVRNVTVVNQVSPAVAGVDAASSTTTVESSVFWANVGSAAVDGAGSQVVRWSLVEGGFAGPGNLDVDPLFVDAAAGDYRLSPESPAIDAGTSAPIADEYPVDFDGQRRATDRPDTADTGVARFGLTVDMGAFEFQPEPIVGNPDCPADLDLSGAVDFADLLSLLSAFGGCP